MGVGTSDLFFDWVWVSATFLCLDVVAVGECDLFLAGCV